MPIEKYLDYVLRQGPSPLGADLDATRGRDDRRIDRRSAPVRIPRVAPAGGRASHRERGPAARPGRAHDPRGSPSRDPWPGHGWPASTASPSAGECDRHKQSRWPVPRAAGRRGAPELPSLRDVAGRRRGWASEARGRRFARTRVRCRDDRHEGRHERAPRDRREAERRRPRSHTYGSERPGHCGQPADRSRAPARRDGRDPGCGARRPDGAALSDGAGTAGRRIRSLGRLSPFRDQ